MLKMTPEQAHDRLAQWRSNPSNRYWRCDLGGYWRHHTVYFRAPSLLALAAALEAGYSWTLLRIQPARPAEITNLLPHEMPAEVRP